MKLFKQHSVATPPPYSSHYNTDKGKLYWSDVHKNWYTRADCASIEYPGFWYSEQPAEVEGKGVDWDAVKDEFYKSTTYPSVRNVFNWLKSRPEFSHQGEALSYEIRMLAHSGLPDECIDSWNEFVFCIHREGEGNKCKQCSHFNK